MLRSARTRASLQALLVTFLWATSWVLIKIGLRDLPALTFAGLRYGLASLCLLPLVARPAHLARLRRLPARAWLQLAALGVLFYTLTQGLQFVALSALPAAPVNLVLSFGPLLVALLGLGLLGERPGPRQWAGMALAALGAGLFFYPVRLLPGQAAGYAAAGGALLANAGSAVLGRAVNRAGWLPPLLVTATSLTLGAALLLGLGLALQGLPPLGPAQWALVTWLGAINTAFAFTLWNHTQRTLSAMESSALNNTLLIQIPLLAWLVLGEALTARQLTGLGLAFAGTLLVQIHRLKAEG